MSHAASAKMDGIEGTVEKHEITAAVAADPNIVSGKHTGIALKSDHDRLGVLATVWRFKKVCGVFIFQLLSLLFFLDRKRRMRRQKTNLF